MQSLSPRVVSRCLSKLSVTPVSILLWASLFQHRSFAISHKLFASKQSDPQIRIRWFRQRDDGSISSEPLDPNKDIIDEEDAEEAAILKKRIAQLEDELGVLKGEQSTLIEPLLAEVPEDEQVKIREAIKKEEEENPDPIEIEEDDDILPSQGLPRHEDIILQLELDGQEAADLKRLFTCIRRVVDDKRSSTRRKQLWRAYLRCKLTLPPFLHIVPDEWWNALWQSQSSVTPDGPNRAEHLCVLLQDMVENGRDLTAEQQLIFIESLIKEDRLDDAVNFWRLYAGNLERDQRFASRYRALGLQIYASKRDFERSYNMALNFLEIEERPQPDDFVPLINLLVRRGDDTNIKKAWTLYLRLKTCLGPRMDLSDYDTLSMCFLKAGRSDLALAVFKDLMLSKKESNFSSTELFRTSRASRGIVGELQNQSIDSTELTKVSLTALTALPRRYQNKFFYGSWMKKLLGMGEVDAAAAILKLMHERKVRPDAKHLNGIIGGWSREGSAASQEKLEQMGWAMVKSRLDFVKQRRGLASPAMARDTSITSMTNIPSSMQAIVCPATVETFSLLLLHYQKRGLIKHINAVRETLDRAEITPNSYFMNHLLFAELHRGDQSKAWSIYTEMAAKVHPDLETFACLWDCEKAWLDKASPYRADFFPSPRHLLQVTTSWVKGLGKHDRENATGVFSNDLYGQILRCFCLSKDLAGAVAALYTLRNIFNAMPDENVARMLIMQVARLGSNEIRVSKRRRGRMTLAQSQGNIAKAAQVLGNVTERRAAELRERGIDAGGLDESQQEGEQLYMMVGFLKAILEQQVGDAGLMQEKVGEALSDMGLDGIHMEDHLQ